MELQHIIYENAKELFRKNGYDKTSLSQIITASNCSKGGFYHYFDSKEDLIPLILNEYETVYIECINSYLDAKGNGYDRLVNYYHLAYRDQSELALKRKQLYEIIMHVDRGELFRKMRKRANGAMIKMMCTLLEEGKEDGSIVLDHTPIVVAKILAREFRYFDERMRKLIERYDIKTFKQATQLRKGKLLLEEFEVSSLFIEQLINREFPGHDIYISNFEHLINRSNELENREDN